jgi:hypothetical protein
MDSIFYLVNLNLAFDLLSENFNLIAISFEGFDIELECSLRVPKLFDLMTKTLVFEQKLRYFLETLTFEWYLYVLEL